MGGVRGGAKESPPPGDEEADQDGCTRSGARNEEGCPRTTGGDSGRCADAKMCIGKQRETPSPSKDCERERDREKRPERTITGSASALGRLYLLRSCGDWTRRGQGRRSNSANRDHEGRRRPGASPLPHLLVKSRFVPSVRLQARCARHFQALCFSRNKRQTAANIIITRMPPHQAVIRHNV